MGTLKCTGPGLPERAVLKAVATKSGMRRRSCTNHAPLVTGVAMPTWLISWKAYMPFSESSLPPLMKMTGLSEV